MKDLVLLLTHSGDYYTIDLVEKAVERLGARPLRLDTDHFPSRWRLSVELRGEAHNPVTGKNPGELRVFLNLPTREVDLAAVTAVWARRLWPGRPPAELDAAYREYCFRESRTAFFDVLALLEEARWVNPLAQGRAAESKLLQLKLATEVGLSIPATTVTNDPDRVRDLYSRVGGQMVTKLLGALSQTMDASGDFVYTSRVKEEDMASIDEVRHAPQIFQSLVPKKRELRAIFVGDKTFVGAISASHTARGQVDWRRLTQHDDVAWTEAALPPAVEGRTRQLLRRLGISFAAVDFIVDPEDRHVFLEVNQAGEWGWLQRDLGFPIAEAIAHTLLEGS